MHHISALMWIWPFLKSMAAENMHTYRYCAVEAGSLEGSSGLHGILGVCWTTQFAWSPLGLHRTNLYTAVVGVPSDRNKPVRSRVLLFYSSTNNSFSPLVWTIEDWSSLADATCLFLIHFKRWWQYLETWQSIVVALQAVSLCFTTGSLTILAFSERFSGCFIREHIWGK